MRRNGIFHCQFLGQCKTIAQLAACKQSAHVASLRQIASGFVEPGHLHLVGNVISVRCCHADIQILRHRHILERYVHIFILHLHIIQLCEYIAALVAQGNVPGGVLDEVGKGVGGAVGHHIVHLLATLGVGQFNPHLLILFGIDAFRQRYGERMDVVLYREQGEVFPYICLLIERQ